MEIRHPPHSGTSSNKRNMNARSSCVFLLYTYPQTICQNRLPPRIPSTLAVIFFSLHLPSLITSSNRTELSQTDIPIGKKGERKKSKSQFLQVESWIFKRGMPIEEEEEEGCRVADILPLCGMGQLFWWQMLLIKVLKPFVEPRTIPSGASFFSSFLRSSPRFFA